jgi:diketogulonate reductase-like aldo/keto reductase
MRFWFWRSGGLARFDGRSAAVYTGQHISSSVDVLGPLHELVGGENAKPRDPSRMQSGELLWNHGGNMPEDEKPTPNFIYGTAWKEELTAELTRKAVQVGFRAIDTANQPKHYQEALVGQALEELASEGTSRDSLYLQTKFTPLNGHDHRVPYDPDADLHTQVRQSFAASLKNLKTDYVDSYLLHGPYSYPGLADADWAVWNAIEEIHRAGGARTIGVSNVNALQLAALVQDAAIKPMVVQNRCYARMGWDRDVREICRRFGIIYQGFSLLTANPAVLSSPKVGAIAARLGVQPEQVVFRFALQIGIIPLTGTTNMRHMREDLQAHAIELTAKEVDFLQAGRLK